MSVFVLFSCNEFAGKPASEDYTLAQILITLRLSRKEAHGHTHRHNRLNAL